MTFWCDFGGAGWGFALAFHGKRTDVKFQWRSTALPHLQLSLYMRCVCVCVCEANYPSWSKEQMFPKLIFFNTIPPAMPFVIDIRAEPLRSSKPRQT